MSRWSDMFARWALRRTPRQHSVTLSQSCIYLLPTAFGWTMLLVAAAVWVGALNYAVSLAYALAFWIVSLLLLSVLLAYRQLSGLKISAEAMPDVFAGAQPGFRLLLGWPQPGKHSLHAGWLDDRASIVPVQGHTLELQRPAARRGQVSMPALYLGSEAPLGLVRAFSYVRLQAEVHVYPAPQVDPLPETMVAAGAGHVGRSLSGAEQFSHLAAWQPQQGARRIVWKAYARQGKLLARQFSDSPPTPGIRLLDWAQFGDQVPSEERLSRLCWQVMEAGRRGETILLRLPQRELSLAASEVGRGLRALAVFGVRDAQ